MRPFLAEVHVAVVTVADDGGRGPLAIPLWYDYRPGGEIVLVTDRGSRKVGIVRRWFAPNPGCSFP